MATIYGVWDQNTFNCVGAYDTYDEAQAVVTHDPNDDSLIIIESDDEDEQERAYGLLLSENIALRDEVVALRAALSHYARDTWQRCDEDDEDCSFILLQHDPTVARRALGLDATKEGE